jgi:hypothetical protein
LYEGGDVKSFQDTMSDYLKSKFPNEKLGNMTDAQWRRAPGLFRIPICDYATWIWNYENWSLNKHPSKTPRCSLYPCCPIPPMEPEKKKPEKPKPEKPKKPEKESIQLRGGKNRPARFAVPPGR